MLLEDAKLQGFGQCHNGGRGGSRHRSGDPFRSLEG
jgi:hypothetical protein